jgi:hypothetical protein
MKINTPRQEVYAIIDGERAYQDSRWNPSTTTSNGDHSWEEWFMYVEHQIIKAKVELSTQPKQHADKVAADLMRKVAALAVASMENLGASPREVLPPTPFSTTR